MFRQLEEFHMEHGHCNVSRHSKKNLKLGRWALLTWVDAQRIAKAKNMLDAERVRRLDDLGFVWSSILDEKWEEMFRQLEEFQKEHGHCRVPLRYMVNPKLGVWVHNQRVANRKGKLTPERIRRLNILGFAWTRSESCDEKWDEMFRQLEEFQMEHGHCRVPQHYKKNPKLGLWVLIQRVANRKGKLPPERKRRLGDLVFAWTRSESCGQKWEEMFRHLKVFKKEHGHCRVPRWYMKDCANNPSLGRWVNTQQTAKSKGKLAPERVRRLDELGIVWSKPRDDGNGTE